MPVIINELSLSGQFIDSQKFYENLSSIGLILSSFNTLQIPIYKNWEFYKSNVTAQTTLHDYKNDHAPEVILFKSELSKIIDEPYWETTPKHSCNDIYTCVYTNNKCMYGLAEAVEDLKVVISFHNDAFLQTNLKICKNGQDHTIKNVYNKETLVDVLIDIIKQRKTSYVATGGDYLPLKAITNKLLPKQSMRDFTAGKGKEEEVVIYRTFGNAVALINLWEFDKVLTSKNDRDIYKRVIQRKNHYLSIDTENGVFELFNSSGNHINEYNYKEEKSQKKPKSHTINL